MELNYLANFCKKHCRNFFFSYTNEMKVIWCIHKTEWQNEDGIRAIYSTGICCNPVALKLGNNFSNNDPTPFTRSHTINPIWNETSLILALSKNQSAAEGFLRVWCHTWISSRTLWGRFTHYTQSYLRIWVCNKAVTFCVVVFVC